METLGVVVFIIIIFIAGSWMNNYGPLADDLTSDDEKKENFSKACKFGIGAIFVIGIIGLLLD